MKMHRKVVRKNESVSNTCFSNSLFLSSVFRYSFVYLWLLWTNLWQELRSMKNSLNKTIEGNLCENVFDQTLERSLNKPIERNRWIKSLQKWNTSLDKDLWRFGLCRQIGRGFAHLSSIAAVWFPLPMWCPTALQHQSRQILRWTLQPYEHLMKNRR